MGKLIGFFTALLLIPVLYSFAFELYLLLDLYADFQLVQWFVYGLLGYGVIYVIFRRRLTFFQYFEHELGHTVVAMLFLRNIREFIVKVDEGGAVGYDQESNFVIRLAPYYLPLFTLPFLLVRHFLPSLSPALLDLAMGLTMGFHYVGLSKEFRASQPDIKRTGLFFSIAFAGILNILFLALTFCVVIENYEILRGYFESSFTRTIDTYEFIVQVLGVS
jgi:hypothetical protein